MRNARNKTMTFEQWMRKVDLCLIAILGVNSEDLSDCPYSDWFEQKVKPERAAKRAIKFNGGE